MVLSCDRDKLTENNMAVIFAVRRYVSSIYTELSKFIQGAEYVGHLTAYSSSLQNIVRKQYEEIKSTIRHRYWKKSVPLYSLENIVYLAKLMAEVGGKLVIVNM